MRRHPEHVRTATLMGVVPPTDPVPLRFPQDAQRALDGVLSDCAADTACRGAFPDLATEVKTVLAGLAKAPVKATVLDPKTGDARGVSLSRDLVNETLRYLMYASGYAGLIPALIHQAAQGDFDPLAEMALYGRRQIVGSVGTGLYITITCAEDLPWIKPGAGERAAAGTFLGDYRLVQQRRACTLWPRAKVPASFRSPVSSPAPVLLLSGQWDPATPPALGEAAARTLPASLHVVVPHGGHSYDGLLGIECIQRLQVQFIERGTVKGLDTSCVADIKRPPMLTSLPPIKPISVPEAEVAKLAGRWRGDGVPVEATVETTGSKLKLALSPERQFLLVPVSPTQFRVAGALGLYAVVEMKDGKPNRMVLEENGSTVMVLKPAEH
jgi:pimeloyl-ACP methyl ester carboxylesterase